MLMFKMFSDNHRYQQGTIHTKRAQALVITLLVISIISVVVIGLVVLSSRDVTQVLNNEKYERLYSESEKRVRDKIQDNGMAANPCGSGTTLPGSVEYNCGSLDISQTGVTANNLSAKVDLKIVDRKSIIDYTLSKDRTLDIALNGYNGEIQFRWNKPVAMEFNVIYTNTSSNVVSVRDVYDLAGVYDSLIGDNPNNDTNNIHDLNFAVLDPAKLSTSTKFNISTSNLALLGTTISLRVTPRMKTPSDVISLTVIPTSQESFPLQIREFISTSIDSKDEQSPIATVVSKIPLNPQIDDIFDYGLLVGNNLVQ